MSEHIASAMVHILREKLMEEKRTKDVSSRFGLAAREDGMFCILLLAFQGRPLRNKALM